MMCSMNAPKEDKLKSVLEAVPAGFVVDSRWLDSHGVSRFLSRSYVERGWLERLERGVFRRPTPQPSQIDWQTCLLSVQHIMGYRVHVGGMTALALQGYSHYLPLGGIRRVWLYGQDVPSWLPRLTLNTQIIMRTPGLFADPGLGLKQDDLGTGASPARSTLPWDWTLLMSSPERAILETLDELPEHESFHNLDMVFEGLVTLSPRRLTLLLQNCRKIKVKRLFFVFADRHQHPWLKRLNPDDFGLGTGDRALVKGGKIHPRYRIMVPPEFSEQTKGAANGP